MIKPLVLLYVEPDDSYVSLSQSLSGYRPRHTPSTRREQIRTAWRPVTSDGAFRMHRNRGLAESHSEKNAI